MVIYAYLCKETVRKLMANAGLWIPRKLRTSNLYQPRNREYTPSNVWGINNFKIYWRM